MLCSSFIYLFRNSFLRTEGLLSYQHYLTLDSCVHQTYICEVVGTNRCCPRCTCSERSLLVVSTTWNSYQGGHCRHKIHTPPLRPVRSGPGVRPLCPRESPRPASSPAKLPSVVRCTSIIAHCWCCCAGCRSVSYAARDYHKADQAIDENCVSAKSWRSAHTAPASVGLGANDLSPCQLSLLVAATSKPTSRRFLKKQ